MAIEGMRDLRKVILAKIINETKAVEPEFTEEDLVDVLVYSRAENPPKKIKEFGDILIAAINNIHVE